MSTALSTEHTPLLENGNHIKSRRSLVDILKAKDEPSWIKSYRFFSFGSWFNILLVFVPLSAIAHYSNWDASLRFSFSFVAIMPLAALLGTATEQLSVNLGPVLSGLLNASFGNAVEIIVGIAALFQGQLRIVQTSLLGSILSNLLLVLGCSFFAGGIKYPESYFQMTAAQASSSLMTLSCITLVIPAAYAKAQGIEHHALYGMSGEFIADQSEVGLRILSRGTALLLLGVYIGFLIFQLYTHHYLYDEDEEQQGQQGQQQDQQEQQDIGPSNSQPRRLAGRIVKHVEVVESQMSIVAAGSALLLVTVVTSFCADYLVASIEETAERYSIPKAFIGLILLPIVANAAEHVTSVWMALKNEMELTITICVGSSIQISTFVIPLLVIIGWITHHDLTLFFADFETIILFVSVLLVNFLIQDGKSNYMEGVMLITLYLVIALAFWVTP